MTRTMQDPGRQVSFILTLMQTIRVRQWTKNLTVFSPLLFSKHFFEPETLLRSFFAFAVFSGIASTVYVINDLVDAEKDRQHPVKRHRPIASGRFSTRAAFITIFILSTVTLTTAWFVYWPLFLTVSGYLVLNIVYSFFLKEAVIIDVMSIAASFVLRIIGGAIAINVPVSEWLLMCTSLLALFLGFSKRRHELTVLENNASVHRPVLLEYSQYFLDQMISLVTASTLICYMLYTVSAETVEKFGTKNLLLTAPFVLYGLFRYLYLVHQKKTGGDPTAELLTDKPLLITVFLWGLAVVLIIYKFR
jgi:4-hydroxybenzoate polyprenyltransferase